MNIVLLCWFSWTDRGSLAIMNRKFEIIGLMTMKHILYLSDGFLQLIGVKSMAFNWSYLFKMFVADDLFRRRLPNDHKTFVFPNVQKILLFQTFGK